MPISPSVAFMQSLGESFQALGSFGMGHPAFAVALSWDLFAAEFLLSATNVLRTLMKELQEEIEKELAEREKRLEVMASPREEAACRELLRLGELQKNGLLTESDRARKEELERNILDDLDLLSRKSREGGSLGLLLATRGGYFLDDPHKLGSIRDGRGGYLIHSLLKENREFVIKVSQEIERYSPALWVEDEKGVTGHDILFNREFLANMPLEVNRNSENKDVSVSPEAKQHRTIEIRQEAIPGSTNMKGAYHLMMSITREPEEVKGAEIDEEMIELEEEGGLGL